MPASSFTPYPPIRAVAFDLDETLYDRDAAVRRLLAAWIPDITPELAAEFLERDGRGYSDRRALVEWLAEWLPPEQRSPDLEARFRGELPLFLQADPAARPVLESLTARGWQLGILTNGRTDYQRAKLAASGLLPWFDPDKVLVTGELGWHKPDARAFRALATACGCGHEEILYVGDHLQNDIIGGKAAGLQTCWLRRRDPGAEHPDADYHIDCLSEILTIPALLPNGNGR